MSSLSKIKTRLAPAQRESKRKAELHQQILRFGIVGVVGFVVNAGMVEWLARSIGPIWAQALAFPVAVTVTWWLNRRYTFGASRHVWHREWLRYVAANALGWGANNGVYFLLIFKFPLAYQYPSLAVAAGSLAGMVFNFAISKWIVFD
jgi:putative flippase GtrA